MSEPKPIELYNYGQYAKRQVQREIVKRLRKAGWEVVVTSQPNARRNWSGTQNGPPPRGRNGRDYEQAGNKAIPSYRSRNLETRPILRHGLS